MFQLCFFAAKETFPSPASAPDDKTSYLYKVRRECRGIIFNASTGELVSRRFHKFFNVDEKEETAANKIDLTQPHVVLDKIDGSLIAPFYVEDELIFATKAGLSDMSTVVTKFIPVAEQKGLNYSAFCREWIAQGYTPLLEWCSQASQVVIHHPEDCLILTGLRNNVTGDYVPYHDMAESGRKYNIPVVNALSTHISATKELVEYVRAAKDTEGFVLRFDDGFMVKMKSDWYLQRHNNFTSIFLLDGRRLENKLWSLVIDNVLDDTLAQVKEHSRADQAQAYAKSVFMAFDKKASEILDEAIYIAKQYPVRREAVAYIKAKHENDEFPLVGGILMKLLNKETINQEVCYEELLHHVKKFHTGTDPKIEKLRKFIAPALVLE